MPLTEANCNNSVDDDADGATDCLDEDCYGSPYCVATLYGAPME